jgi:hypothetical protein
MKTCGGSESIAPPFLTSALGGGEGSASSPGRFTCVGGPPEAVWTLWSREKFLSLAENRALAVQPVMRSYTD